MNTRQILASVTLISCAVGGCQGFIYGTTGDVMSAYTVDHVVPAMMQDRDVGIACHTGLAFAAFLGSFRRVTDEPNRASLVTLLSAGMCAELEAREAELSSLRALNAGSGPESQDQRIREKRLHAVAARRYLTAYNFANAAFGDPGGPCPALEDKDEHLYLLGLAAGVNAVLHDRSADGAVGVPMDIPVAVARASGCIDDAKWFGVPPALRGAVYATVPGSAPEGVDIWDTLTHAAQLGDKAGVRLARALQVQALVISGRQDESRTAISAHAASRAATPGHESWRLLDEMGDQMVRHESDKLWTAETGHRTPMGALGTFHEVPQIDDVDDSLLDDLGPESESEAPSATEKPPAS